MAESPRLSIVVVSFNTRDVTLECLRSVFSETRDASFELIVVDNASSDGSAEAIGEEFGQVRLIGLDENIGFGRANNLAAEQSQGDLLLLLNPDTVVLDGAIDKLVAFADSRPEAGIWGGRTLFGDRSLNPTSCWRGMSLWGLFCRGVGLTTLFPNSAVFNSEGYGGWQRDSIRRVDTVTGCFFLIRTSLWRELEGFDPAFYMYGEEADLCLRARRLGAGPVVTPDAEIIHYGGMSETVPADKIGRLMRAKMTLANKHWSPLRRFLARSLFRLLSIVRLVGYSGAARALGRPRLQEKAATWRRVWQTREDWLKGYE